MRRNLMLHVCLNTVAGLATLAAPAKQPDTETLTVKLYNYAEVPSGILSDAEKETARILRAAGIELSWAPCPVSDRDFQSAPAKFAACRQAPDAPIMRIERRAILPDRSVAGAAKDEQIAVSYPHVEEVCGVSDISRAKLLGHVMAHELGHVLLADHSHAPDGIMIASFRKQELHRAEIGNLLFTPRQATRMRAGLRERGLTASTPSSN